MTFMDREHRRYERMTGFLLLAEVYVIVFFAGMIGSLASRGCDLAVAGDSPPALSKPTATTATADLTPYAPMVGMSREPYGLVAYDNGLKTPRLVLHQITKDTIVGDAERPSGFFADESIDKRWRTHPGWFTNSGDDRGHCAPCADFKYSQRVMNACMSLKNIMLQNKELNEGPWSKLEASIRQAADDDGCKVTICTGPAWKSEGMPIVKTRVVHGIAEGTHCFKAILIERETGKTVNRECLAWLAPNRKPKEGEKFDDWRLSTDELEEVIGWDLWPNLSVKEAAELESRR
jgi:endonuclease G